MDSGSILVVQELDDGGCFADTACEVEGDLADFLEDLDDVHIASCGLSNSDGSTNHIANDSLYFISALFFAINTQSAAI
jgi:hypothetical protein